eukprot:707297-Pyramimonas_sp.AAC.1
MPLAIAFPSSPRLAVGFASKSLPEQRLGENRGVAASVSSSSQPRLHERKRAKKAEREKEEAVADRRVCRRSAI